MAVRVSIAMREEARIRKFLDLTQRAVSLGTGIAIGRISAFERGACRLNPAEEGVLRSFLRTRLEIALEADREAAASGEQGTMKLIRPVGGGGFGDGC